MFSQETTFTITADHIAQYAAHLQEQERAKNTVKKYVHDLHDFMAFLNGQPITKGAVIAWKEHLADTYTPATVNSMLAAVNGFFHFMDWPKLSVKPLKVQRPLFCDENREMTRAEYVRLVDAARRQGNERLALLLQTICATGIRVSELRFITVEAAALGRTVVSNKGKRRTVFFAGEAVRPTEKICEKTKNHRRVGVCNADGKAP